VVAFFIGITLDGNMHSQTRIEDDREKRFNWHKFGQSSKSIGFSEGIFGKSRIGWHCTTRSHVHTGTVVHTGEGWLGELNYGQIISAGVVGRRGGCGRELCE